jgi:uncharacterized protein
MPSRPKRAGKPLSRLDPRAPLVFDTRDLGRRAGAMRTVSRTVPAPTDLGIGVVGVPATAEIELDIRFESVVDGVYVSGTARAPLAGECVRCLDPFEDDLEATFGQLFAYPDRRDEEVAEDEDTLLMEGDLLDLEPVLRDAVVLALPLRPVCRDDCPGLCSECGARLADDPDHHHEAVDPRWAALRGFSGATAPGMDDDTSGAAGAGGNQES